MLELETFSGAGVFLARALDTLESRESENAYLTSTAMGMEPGAESPGRRWVVASRDGRAMGAALVASEGLIALSSFADNTSAREAGAALRAKLAARRSLVDDREWRALGPEDTVQAFASGWAGPDDTPIEPTLRQTLLRLDLAHVQDPTRGKGPFEPSRLTLAARSDVADLRRWMRAFDRETNAPERQPPAESWVTPAIERGACFVWRGEDGRPWGTASVGGRTRLGGRIHLVYVPPERRRCGIARSCVRALCLHLANEGLREATLFADSRSSEALALYKGLGFQPACDQIEATLWSSTGRRSRR